MKTTHPHRSFRLQVFAVVLIPLLLAVGLLAVYCTQRSGYEMQQVLNSQGHASAKYLAESSASDLRSGNLANIQRVLDYALKVHRFKVAAISDGSHWLLVSGEQSMLPRLTNQALPSNWQDGPVLFYAHPVPSASGPLQKVARIAQPATLAHHYVVVSLSRTPIELSRSRAGLAAFVTALISTVIALLLAWRLSGQLSRPLDNVISTVAHLAGGELSERTPEISRGEIGMLESGINQMAKTLEENQNTLRMRVQEATAHLLDQKLAADAALLAKSRFLAAASHDMRQPLHALTLLVAALRDHVPEGEATRLARHIESSAAAMESLLSALLDLSKIDAGVIQARPQCFPVQHLLDRIAEQFLPMASVQDIQLRLAPSSQFCYSDSNLVERILANLVSNALRYTEHGRVMIGVRHAGKDWLRFEVRDNGKGIPPEFQALIFEEYYQLENTDRNRDKGLGLGLAIVSKLTRLLGSQIKVDSIPGRGAIFSFQLARCHASNLIDEPIIKPGNLNMPLENALVVIIDDDETVLSAMVELFDRWNVPLAAGIDAEQVCIELESINRTPDLILCDYRLANGLNGIQAVQVLRNHFGNDIPAALITGDTASETMKLIKESDLPVLHKPIQPARLRAFLSHLLSESSDNLLSTRSVNS